MRRAVALRRAGALGAANIGAFYFSSPNGDWTVPGNGNLWLDDIKTLFDPCPGGWRVPRSGLGRLSPWAAFTLDNSAWFDTDDCGRHFAGDKVYPGVTVWYAASGRREPSSSGVNFVKIAFVGWSSRPAFYFRMDNGSVNPEAIVGQRSVGYSVRCIRE